MLGCFENHWYLIQMIYDVLHCPRKSLLPSQQPWQSAFGPHMLLYSCQDPINWKILQWKLLLLRMPTTHHYAQLVLAISQQLFYRTHKLETTRNVSFQIMQQGLSVPWVHHESKVWLGCVAFFLAEHEFDCTLPCHRPLQTHVKWNSCTHVTSLCS